MHLNFDFRVLRQNRRLVAGTEAFHGVLSDIAQGLATDRVRDFIVGAYVRGRSCVTAQDAEFEESTAVFTKRRYRDKWNRTVVKRVGESHAHCIKIKARVRAKGQRGTGWYGEKRVQFLRSKCRTQMRCYGC